MEKIKLDGRLGFSLDISQEEFAILTGEDRAAAKELLVKLVQSEQCHIVGDTYFPVEWNEDVLNYEMENNLSFNLPVISINAGSVDKYKIAKNVEFENFKNAMECLDHSPADYSGDDLYEMLNDLNDKLANDDVYNAIYNEVLGEVIKSHEKVNSVEGLIVDAKNKSEDLNKDISSKDDVVHDKE